MSRVVVLIAIGTVVILGLMAGSSRASLYSPEDSTIAVPVGSDGKAQALPLEIFESRLATFTNALDERKKDGKVNADREHFLERIEKTNNSRNMSADEAAAMACDLLRVGQLDRAINVLMPRTRDRRPNYFVFLTLSHIYATRGEWLEAIGYCQDGLSDAEMPTTIKGLTPAQRDWWKQLDKQYLMHYYQLRKHDTDIRKGVAQAELEKINETEDVLPLFPLPDSKSSQAPVRFVNDAGIYQPGHLAAAEKAKLPTDAIAIVQQLLLWFPGDTRLYWLLAELYAASNNLKAAATLFEKSSWSRQFGNRKVMMDHRVAVRNAALKDAPAEDAPLTQTGPNFASTPEPQPLEQAPISMRTIWFYFGAVGLIVVFAFIRAMSRRSKNDCGPVG